jgi:hypothetical protein
MDFSSIIELRSETIAFLIYLSVSADVSKYFNSNFFANNSASSLSTLRYSSVISDLFPNKTPITFSFSFKNNLYQFFIELKVSILDTSNTNITPSTPFK